MERKPEIKQVSTIGSQGTQIGIQNVNVGVSPQAASQIAINLFMENFPKLQEEARRVAQERADAFCNATISKLEKEGVKDYFAFKDPDVQYALLEAQKKYARLGTAEMLETLSSLICKRVQNDKDFELKIAIDKAIEIAPMLKMEQLNYLTLLFYAKRVVFRDTKTLEDFSNIYAEIAKKYNIVDLNSISYLNIHGCLQIHLGSVLADYSEKFGKTEEELEKMCPLILKQFIHNDYAPSYVGIILAIINIEIKTGEKYDPHIWVP